jgi:hypothetical protein
MSEANSPRPRRHVGGHTIVKRILLSSAGILLIAAACRGTGTAPDELEVYRVIRGACGKVVFSEAIGTDSASAFRAVEARKIAEHGIGSVRLPNGLSRAVSSVWKWIPHIHWDLVIMMSTLH